MKYKVVLYNSGQAPDVDISANFSFYRKADAQNCAFAWTELYGINTAMLWDGQTWVYWNG